MSQDNPKTHVRILLLTNIITAIALLAVGILYYRCQQSAMAKVVPGAVTPCPPDTSIHCANTCYPFYPGAFSGVNGELARELVENYRIHQWASYSQAAGFEDARAVWFSVERIKQFIYQIEQTTCAHKCDTNAVLGIRIYFGAYPDLATWDHDHNGLVTSATGVTPLTYAVDASYEKHHTLMMVPTYYDPVQHQDVDFDPLHWGNDKCTPDRVDTVMTTMGFLVPTYFPNHGGDWPPSYDGRFY